MYSWQHILFHAKWDSKVSLSIVLHWENSIFWNLLYQLCCIGKIQSSEIDSQSNYLYLFCSFFIQDERMIRKYREDTEKMRSQMEELKTWYAKVFIFLDSYFSLQIRKTWSPLWAFQYYLTVPRATCKIWLNRRRAKRKILRLTGKSPKSLNF